MAGWNRAIGWAVVWMGGMMAGAQAQAQSSLPLWDAGLGLGVVRVPDYAGAGHRSNYVVPTPVVVVRGRYLRSDRDGVRGVFLDTDRWEFDVSGALTPAAKSADNPRRVGMDNLRPTVGLGPSLNYAAWRGDRGRLRWDVLSPLRASYTVESTPRFVGWVWAPGTTFTLRDVAQVRQLDVMWHATADWADRRYLQRTFGVGPQEATPTRPVFEPSGGYAGSQVGMRLIRRMGPLYIGVGMTRYFLQGAQVAHSPLVEARASTMHWLFMSWMLMRSSEPAGDAEAR